MWCFCFFSSKSKLTSVVILPWTWKRRLWKHTFGFHFFRPFDGWSRLLRKLMLFLKKSMMMGPVIAQLTLFQNLKFFLSCQVIFHLCSKIGASCFKAAALLKNICDRNVWLFWQKCPWLTHRSITVERKSTSLEIENLWKGRNSRTQKIKQFFLLWPLLLKKVKVLLLDLFRCVRIIQICCYG